MEVVVDVEVSASRQKNADLHLDERHLALHNSYMKGSAMGMKVQVSV